MGTYVDMHIQITGWTTMLPRFAFTVEANPIPAINTGRNFDRQGLLFLYSAVPMTLAAGRLNDAAATVTAWSGLLQGKEPLLHAYLAVSPTGRTGYRAGAFLGTTTAAFLTFDMGRHTNIDAGTPYRLFEC